MALFISYLYNSSYAPSTVNTYISALGYCHKLLGLSDPSKVFYVSQMFKIFTTPFKGYSAVWPGWLLLVIRAIVFV